MRLEAVIIGALCTFLAGIILTLIGVQNIFLNFIIGVLVFVISSEFFRHRTVAIHRSSKKKIV